MKLKRKIWKENQKNMFAPNLVFLDESSININMTRLYGRARKKERVHDGVVLNKPKNTTLLSSVRMDGTLAHCSFEGALTGEQFLNYVKNILAPTLHENDIVIMDNLSSHKVNGVVDAIKEKKASVLFLPPYSPDLNPIEMMWSKIKALLRKWKARSIDLLNDAVEKAFLAVSKDDIFGWFSHAGYSASKLELL